MPRFCKLSAFTLALVLFSTVALAGPRHSPASPRAGSAASRPMASSIANLAEWLTGVWSKAGCILDPDGLCLGNTSSTAAPPIGQGDAGCILDPNGSPCAGGR